MTNPRFQRISVIVPANPFVSKDLRDVKHCLTALDVEKLMKWWPGTPHEPHRNAQKVTAIQRSLDWKRVVQIAAYLLQAEIPDAPDRVDEYFRDIYEPKQNEPGREWPPHIPRVIGFQRSAFPTFSNVLLHINGAKVEFSDATGLSRRPDRSSDKGTATLVFDEESPALNFSVIDGQHRINGAYLAVMLKGDGTKWEIPSEIFLDLDARGTPPRRQAQIFIDVNSYQKKVDRSLVADLFPTARGPRDALDHKERAQDLGRRLMLEVGPLVGLIQVPGIKYGVKEVVALATLNSAIEDLLPTLEAAGITSLAEQAEFIAQCLDAWLDATGWKEDSAATTGALDPENVVYQGRFLVSAMTLIPACLLVLRETAITSISERAFSTLAKWFRGVIDRAGMLKRGKFLPRSDFKKKGFYGSGGIARLRNLLWAAASSKTKVGRLGDDALSTKALLGRGDVTRRLAANG